MSLNYSFANKRVLISGGASGIGRQLVQRFYDDGAVVFTVDKNSELVEKLCKELPNITAEVVDLSDWKATKSVIEAFGPIDHLINNAAVVKFEDFLDISEEASLLQYSVNVGAVINVSQVVAKGMIQVGNGGTILNISSMVAKKYLAGVSCYGATKAALAMLTKSMAVELGTHGIRVNCIHPGAVDSPMAKDAQGNVNEQCQRLINQIVLKRLVDPNEIADLALFLLSPLSSMITGEEVSISGGWL